MAQRPPAPAKPIPAPAKDVTQSRSFLRDDFPIIRKASITFGVCIVLAAALIGGSGFILSKQEAKKVQAESELRQAQGKYKAAETEKNEIREFQPKYVQLVQRGFVGDEKRLDTIENVRNIQESRKLLPITYEIAPQQIFQIDPSIQIGELELRGSPLVVRMGLLHEMDLIGFLTDLNSKGTFSPQVCSIKIGGAASISPLSAKLQGECTLYWITMGRRAAVEGEPPKAAAQ